MKTGLPTSGKLLFSCHQPENCCSNCRGKMIYKFCNYTMYYLSNIENRGVHTLVLNELVSSH